MKSLKWIHANLSGWLFVCYSDVILVDFQVSAAFHGFFFSGDGEAKYMGKKAQKLCPTGTDILW